MGLLLAVLGLLLYGASPAAAILAVKFDPADPGHVRVTAVEIAGSLDPAANNLNLSFTEDAAGVDIIVTDPADQVLGDSGCSSVSFNQAVCPIPASVAPADIQVTVALGSEDDVGTSLLPYLTTWIEGPGDDVIAGGPGRDIFRAGPSAHGSDVMRGYGGTDEVDYSQRALRVNVKLDAIPNDGFTGEEDNVHGDIEVITGTPYPDVLEGTGGHQTLVGGAGADALRGSGGDDMLIGGPGNDLLEGGNGADAMFGGDGSDLVTYAGRPAGVNADPTDAGDDGSGSDGLPGARDTIGADVETIIGGDAGDTLGAGPGGTTLEGRLGDDVLTGGDGHDVLRGDGGDDLISGGPGSDGLEGADGHDTLRGGEGHDIVDGGAGDDDLDGEAGDDLVAGRSGNDTIAGGAGRDRLAGEGGDDALHARDATVDELIDCGTGTDTAQTDADDPATAGCESEDRTALPPPPPPPPPGPATPEGQPPGAGSSAPPPASGVSPAGTTLAVRNPAKIRVLRVGVKDGRLDMRVEITSRATGELRLVYHSAGRRTTFRVAIPRAAAGATSALAWSFTHRLPASQRRTATGIVTLTYAGNDRVRTDDVRLRAASGRALLVRETARIDEAGRLRVAGTASRRAVGVVRVRLGYVKPDGTVAFLRYRARIERPSGRSRATWSLREKLPADAAAAGGQLSIQYTGYLPRRIRGEQTSKAVSGTG